MTDIINCDKDSEEYPLNRRIDQLQEALERLNQQDIKRAIDLLEENGYSVKKIEKMKTEKFKNGRVAQLVRAISL